MTKRFGSLYGALAVAVVAASGIIITGATLNQMQESKLAGYSFIRHQNEDVAGTDARGPVAMRVKWIGTTATGDASIAVAAGGDITVEGDDGAVDTSISTDGVIDLSTPAAAENTIGEVCDIFNNDTDGNWQCILVDLLASESSDNTLATLGETATTGISSTYDLDGNGLFDNEGIAILTDITVTDAFSVGLTPAYFPDEWISQNSSLLSRRPWPDLYPTVQKWRAEFDYATFTQSWTTVGGAIQLVIAKRPASAGDPNVGGDYAGMYEEVIFNMPTAVATGVAETLTRANLPPIEVPRGAMLFFRIEDTSTPDITAGNVNVSGRLWQE